MGRGRGDWDDDTSDPSWPREKRDRRRDRRRRRPPRLSLWGRFARWLRRLFGLRERPALPPRRRPWLEHAAATPEDVRPLLEAIPDDAPDEVLDIVGQTVEDYAHLAELVERGALAEAPLAGVELLGEAHSILTDVATRAANAATVMQLAERRRDDPGAQSAAETVLARLRAESTALHDAASSAIQFAATLSDDDGALLSQRAERMHLLIGEINGGT